MLDRALTLEPRDYVTHFLLYRWYAERGLGAGFKAQKHVYEAGQYGTRDSAIGLWGLGRREWCKSEDLSGTQRTRALERGVELCTQALAKRPDFTWALTMRGFCRRGLGRWKQAMADHDAVIRLSGQAFSYYNRGILHHVMQQYDKAQADYDTAIRLRPRYAKACIRRGRLHHEMKRYAKALADYDTAIRLAPRFGRAYINRGRLHHEMKRYAKAQADYDTAIRIYPRYAQAYIERGSLHAGLKRYRQAIEDWKRALLLARTAARKQRIGDLIRDVRSRIK